MPVVLWRLDRLKRLLNKGSRTVQSWETCFCCGQAAGVLQINVCLQAVASSNLRVKKMEDFIIYHCIYYIKLKYTLENSNGDKRTENTSKLSLKKSKLLKFLSKTLTLDRVLYLSTWEWFLNSYCRSYPGYGLHFIHQKKKLFY